MNYILCDDQYWGNLFPLTIMRPMADLRIGILTIREKWEEMLGQKTSTHTESYLNKRYPAKYTDDNIYINGSICPNNNLVKKIHSLKSGQALVSEDYVVAARTSGRELEFTLETVKKEHESIDYKAPHLKISNVWDIFAQNGETIKADFALLTNGRKSEPVPEVANLQGDENIFVEPGAKVRHCIINATTGPVYIGKDAEVMEGCLIRGPFALCDHATLKMGAKIYGPTTIGPQSKVGGEVNNAVIFGYTNKAHDGFLGNSVIAEWCNIGADTNTSNLKNTYDSVKLWNYQEQRFVNTGLQFCGLIMGDHSKCGINTMFNTGTVVGVSCNIYGSGFQRNYIPSFSWGGVQGFTTFDLSKAMDVAKRMYARRSREFDKVDEDVFKAVFSQTGKQK